MKTLALLISLILASAAQAGSGLFIEGGFAYQSTSIGAPEYTARNPLGDIGIGYTFDFGLWDLDLYLKHRSSIPDTEKGFGQNLVGVRIRKYFK